MDQAQRYCFFCGTRLQYTLLPTEDRERLNCPNCGYIHYVNPKVVCGTLPLQHGKVWLLRRGIEPRYGYWTYPAGFQEIDESTEQGAVRETSEELGCTVVLDSLLGIYSRPQAPVNVVYLAHLSEVGGTPHITPEAIAIEAFAPEDIPWSELAFISTQEVLRDWARLTGVEPE